MKKTALWMIAILVAGMIIGVGLFFGLPLFASNEIASLDHFWPRALLAIISFLLACILGIQLYEIFHYPTAARLILRVIAFFMAICIMGTAPPLVWLA